MILENAFYFSEKVVTSIEQSIAKTTTDLKMVFKSADAVSSLLWKKIKKYLFHERPTKTVSKTHILERMNILLKQLYDDQSLSGESTKYSQSSRSSSQFQVRLLVQFIIDHIVNSKLYFDVLFRVTYQCTL
jgi:hypothetical protein